MGDRGSLLTATGCGALVFVISLAVVYATPHDAYWVADCGNKALLAERLHDDVHQAKLFLDTYTARRLIQHYEFWVADSCHSNIQ